MRHPEEDLLRRIADAFDGVERGNGTTWMEGEGMDNHASPEELAAARALDAEGRWQDVPPDRFEMYSSPPWFLNAEGFRYYLPAVMTWSLTEGARSSSATEDQFLSLLRDAERQGWLVEGLTSDQLHVTADWVWHVTESWYQRDEGKTGELRRFWARYRAK